MDKETNQRHHGDQGTEVSHPYLAKQDSYTRDQPRSPVVAATAARNHDSSLTSETIPRIAAGRSVKSIVQWIEAAAQPSSPSTKSTIGDTSSHKEKAKSTNATAPTPPVQVTSPSRFGRAPIGADDEELSLAFLKYQEFFNDKPLLLRIKDVPDDICDISVDEMVRRAEQTNMSEKAKVVVDWSNYKVTDSSIKVPEQHLDLDLDKPCGKPAVIADINAAGHSDKSQKTLEKSHQVEVALAEKTSPDAPQLEQPFIQRDPDEVKKFWGQVRNYLWISDEELESSSDQDSDSPPMPKGVSTQPFTQKTNRQMSQHADVITQSSVCVEAGNADPQESSFNLE
ncbi:hypothetical protein CDD82_3429 [Ophiocordyceps australis]|uniref:Uncharacterized protein n=1 Tax=Ophiocordyceps australis TaxID=1399860 RepID=A0A2C5ZT13_9HYPO|nr:hypothetical protein CDD82_3429 [Ophiocordyceps australis]